MLKQRNWKRWMFVVSMVAAVALLVPAVTLAAGGPPTDRGRGTSAGMGTGMGLSASGEMDAATEAALVEAIEEEYGALALYEAVMEQFGEVQPFVSIAQSEAQHAAALANLFEKYGLDVPAMPTDAPLPTFATIEEACAAGVEAELIDAALYDTLSVDVTAPDILRVFANLQNASLNSHLPAFEACVEGTTPEATGYGPAGNGMNADATGYGTAGQGAQGQGQPAMQRGNGAVTAPRYNATETPADCPAYRDGAYRGR